MRSFILIALLCAVASATYVNKNRFYNLLNRYQQRNRFDLSDNLYGGYSFADDYDIDDYDYDTLNGGDDDDLLLSGRRNLWQQQYGRGQNQWDLRDQEFDLLRRDDLLRNDDDYYNNNDIDQDQWDEDKWIRRSSWQTRGDIDNILDQDQDQDQWTQSPHREVQDANVKLASRLYKQTKEDKDDKNTVVSPLSIQLALAALNKGARGNTKRQIGRVIGGRTPAQQRRQVLSVLARQIRRQRGNELSTIGQSTRINPVTVIAINTRTPAQQWFIQSVVNSQPGVRVKHCNFHNQPRVCRKMINNLVSQKTNMKINQIVPRDAITDNTKMVLVNALEMKAPWGRQMRNHVTKSAKFFPLDTNKVKIVEVMETEGRFKYYEDELVKIVGIPTEQHEMTFYTIVPKHKDGLTAVEKLHVQDNVQLKQILRRADQNSRHVGVQLPKFQIKHKIDVRRTLRKQGVTDAFDAERADFSRITGVNKERLDEFEDELQNNNNIERLGSLQNEFDNNVGGLFGGGDKKVHLNKFIHQANVKVTEHGITTTSTQLDNNQFDRLDDITMIGGQWNNRLGGLGDFEDQMDSFDDVRGLFRGGRRSELMLGGEKMVKANRGFAFVVKHNPTNQLILIGRVIDAAQRNVVNSAFQTINNVDQL